MVDTMKGKPLRIESYDGQGGILDLPVEQLAKVQALLDANQVKYWVNEEYLSVDGGPETAFIMFSTSENAAKVQRILDSAA